MLAGIATTVRRRQAVMKMIAGLAVASTAMLAAFAYAAPNLPKFENSNLRASIRALSSSAFAGRAPDTIGEKKSIAYVA
ncbi:MAG: hypothetical protein KGL92_04125 [Gammaproteobacteria bacterium]|nr:hypothetical protein [Gammaproteobacteria bacterium]